MYSALPPKRMNGNEPLLLPNGKKVANLKDFWSWAYSDLISNAERGALAEYIVACALGVNSTERGSWNKYDLVTPEGIRSKLKPLAIYSRGTKSDCHHLRSASDLHMGGTILPTNT